MENSYGKGSTENEYPIRTFQSGQKGALELALTGHKQERDFNCNANSQGFTIFLTVPGEVLESPNNLLIDFSEDTSITIKPKVTTISKGLRSYKPMQRECLISSERQLRFFKTYTQHNCNMECLRNFTIKECGCVRFSMPSMH